MAGKRKRNAGAGRADLYPIRTVSSLTGINAITLRAWETRYGLLAPERTDGGHRLYTQSDIDRIHRIVAERERGVAISQVRRALEQRNRERPRAQAGGPWGKARDRMATAISQFDECRLEDDYNELLALHPAESVTRNVVLPLLADLGERWQTGSTGIAEEHFFGVYLRNKLGARFHHRARLEGGPRIIAACLPGEHHETGLLMFSLAAHDRGFRVVLLGADMPAAQLAHAARQARADAIVLSGSVAPPAGLLERELPALLREAGVPVFVGGPTSVRAHDAIVAAGARPLGDDIESALRHLAGALLQNAS